MRIIRGIASAVAILSLAGAAAFAQGAPSVKKACAADMQKLCAGLSDRHAARQCMMSHMEDLSPDCHAAIEAMRAARAARKAQAASAGGPPAAGAPPAADGPPAGGPH